MQQYVVVLMRFKIGPVFCYVLQVSIDVRAPEAGTLVEQMAAEGDTVEVGAPLMKLDTLGGGGGGGAAKKPAPGVL